MLVTVPHVYIPARPGDDLGQRLRDSTNSIVRQIGRSIHPAMDDAETKMPDIPYDLVTLILARLPPELLLRFSRVCKAWRSTISSDPLLLHIQREFMLRHLPRRRKRAGNMRRLPYRYRRTSIRKKTLWRYNNSVSDGYTRTPTDRQKYSTPHRLMKEIKSNCLSS